MPQSISEFQLKAYKDQIATGGVTAVRQVYAALQQQGYQYAGWALGVATGTTVTGQSALQFLQGSAMMGIGSEACKNISAAQIDQVRVKMADETLNSMISVAKTQGGGFLTRELDYKETEAFHARAFAATGLNIDNWTLKAPMDLLRQTYGDAYVEKVWSQLRQTGGVGVDSLLMSAGLNAAIIQMACTSRDPSVVQKAQNWLDQVPGLASGKQITTLFNVLNAIVPNDLVADPFTGVALPGVGNYGVSDFDLRKLTGNGLSTTRLNDIWVTTDLGNGARLLQASDKNGGVLVLSSGIYQKLEIPDGKGGYLQIGIGDKSTTLTAWSGVPDQSIKISSVITTQSTTANGQTAQVTETVNFQASGNQVSSVKDMITQGGARIVNSTTADGHLQEETWATVNGQQTLQSSKTISYSQAERNTAAMDVSLAGLEFLQALRHGNKVQAAGSLIRLVNNAEIASNKMPTLGAIGTGFSGAVSLISALDSWGCATDGERIALAARAVLGANEVAKAFSANGQTGFLNSAPGATALNVAGGIVALAGLEDTLHSGNPFAIASSAMALTNGAVALDLVASSAAFGPEAMIAVAIASIIFGGLFGGSVQYPAPPPAGTVEVGALADGSLGMLFKDGDGKAYQTRYMWGGVYSDTYKATDKRDWSLGADILSQRMLGLIGELNAQAAKDGTHLVLDRLPTLSVHGYPSFDRNGVGVLDTAELRGAVNQPFLRMAA